MNIAVSLVRRLWTWGDARRDRGLVTPEDVERADGLRYGPDRTWHTLDLYRPRGAAGPLPVIVSIHGGGYCYGGTVPYQFYGMSLAQLGFAVVSFNYRLAPEHTFPAPLEDTNALLCWLMANAGRYGLDRDNVCLVGDSAGAQLASQYAALWSDGGYAALMGIRPPQVGLRAVGLNCGMYDLAALARATDLPGRFYRSYLTRDPSVWGEKLAVLDHITARFPPTYLMSAPGDFLCGHCRPMAELLEGRGVPVRWRIYGDKGTPHVFHLNVRSPLAREANREETDFFRQFLCVPSE